MMSANQGHPVALVGRSHFLGLESSGSKPDSTEDPPNIWACCTLNHPAVTKRLPVGAAGVQVCRGQQVSSRLSDLSSKLRVRPKITRVASNGR
ncbi:hypothetical protein AVEN_224885-1 [Araneus ventricosus]|uniref:Uncharacterized protein n=1 Tax=Araneus ventricosus TaxID=182803 RepID=A0A4Y2PNZ8_ARAVE|nr:hypothetical protein AVEN_224885-1 [Araneus ventricosus]